MPERPCIDCGEPTLNAERCRDCNIEHAWKSGCCSGCGRFHYNEEVGEDVFGWPPFEHAAGCPEIEVEDARRRTCAHYWVERKGEMRCAMCRSTYAVTA